LLLLLVLVTSAVPAYAAPTSPETLRIAQERLERSDAASVEQALAMLSGIGGEPAARLVIERLRRGLPPQLVEAAIDALVLLGRPSAGPALLELTSHFRAPIRARAVAALGALSIKSAQSALLYALNDPSPEVRVAAVQALSVVGTARALPTLYLAADRGVDGALLAVGKIASAADVKTLLERAPNGDVSAIRTALDAMLERQNLALAAKLRIVRELGQLATPSARACLVQ
jgi:HEAT repeats